MKIFIVTGSAWVRISVLASEFVFRVLFSYTTVSPSLSTIISYLILSHGALDFSLVH